MDLNAFIRQFFFGYPGNSFGRRSPQIPTMDESDEMNSQHFPSFEQSFANIFKEMEGAMEEIARSLGSIEIGVEQDWNIIEPPSLRDQMLKPGYSDHSHESREPLKMDTDLDPSLIPKENFDHLFDRKSSMYPNNLHTSRLSRSSVTIRNGAVTEHREENDMEGCQRKVTTHQYEGKKYVIEKRQCPGGEESTVEHFDNLSREEVPNFLKRFQR